MTSARTGNSTLQLLEGESAKVCALLLLEPEEFETDVEMRVQQSSGELKLAHSYVSSYNTPWLTTV